MEYLTLQEFKLINKFSHKENKISSNKEITTTTSNKENH